MNSNQEEKNNKKEIRLKYLFIWIPLSLLIGGMIGFLLAIRYRGFFQLARLPRLAVLSALSSASGVLFLLAVIAVTRILDTSHSRRYLIAYAAGMVACF